MDVRKLLLETPMSRLQIGAVAIIAALNALDGFDILSIAFAAPGISQQWGVAPAALGIVFSAGAAGMAVGAATLSGFGDIFGRRPAMLAFLAVMTVGTWAAAASPDILVLTACRFLTGLGIGGLIAVLNVMAGEQANAARRNLAIGFNSTGFSMGGVVGGFAAARLLAHYDWRSVFICGGAASALGFVVVAAYMPESIEFLISRQRPDSLRRVNAILARMGRASVSQLPPPLEIVKIPVARLLRGDLAPAVGLFIAAYLLLVMIFYYIAVWAPQVARTLGGGPSDVANLSALISASGVAGTLALGLLAGRIGLARVTVITVVASSLAIAGLGWLPSTLGEFAASAAVAGFFVFASFTGVYALIVQSFATEVRASACGLIVGVGRLGAVASPILVGWLYSSGFNLTFVCGLMAICALVAALAIAGLQALRNRGRAAPAFAPV